MGKTFRKVFASSVGSFEDNTNKIPQWITANGGNYSKTVSSETTHLIASREAFMQNIPAVAEAKKFKSVNIVSCDWLVDSLLSTKRMPLAARPYLWENILKEEKLKGSTKKSRLKKGPAKTPVKRGLGRSRKSQATAKATKSQTKETQLRPEGTEAERGGQIEESQTEGGQPKGDPTENKRTKELKARKKRRKKRTAKSKDPFDSKPRTAKAASIAAKYHLYEADGVTYSATLVRLSSCRNSREKVQLKIYESNSDPHDYATHIKFSRHGLSRTEMLAPMGSTLDTAMAVFKELFESQAGKKWEDRLDGIAPPPRRDENGDVYPPNQGWFYYDTGHESLFTLIRDGKI
ncbi:hypothetical protein BJX61DRAFT_434115 [Aspergillus egyptiacus]|nr:hypothetical protein BJX61DRAFT_434115 [Aspergillus egyptiacus]